MRDEAIEQILNECYAAAKRLVTENRNAMERVTRALLEQETLSKEEFIGLMEQEPVAV